MASTRGEGPASRGWRAAAGFYSWQYPQVLVGMLRRAAYRPGRYLAAFWKTTYFDTTLAGKGHVSRKDFALVVLLYTLTVAEVVTGLAFIWQWWQRDLTGGLAFGLALIIAYPIVLAHALALFELCSRLLNPKRLGKQFLCFLFSRQIVRLRKRHTFTVVAVAGSVGKTSTKMAIARLLQATRRVRWQEGNYNDPVTVPLVFFGHNEPHIFNILAWVKILFKNEQALRRPYPYDVVVVELGTDTPGTIPQFAYIRPDVSIVTAVELEHMAFFGTLNAVAKEELAVFDYSQTVLVNTDDVAQQYLTGREYHSYGLNKQALYRASERQHQGYASQSLTFHVAGAYELHTTVPFLGEQGAKITLAAVAVAHELGLSKAEIQKGLANVQPFAGRMQLLDGVQNAALIDDTYNASPASARAALDVLQGGDAPQRIAILGSMNELGAHSEQAHKDVGAHCNPKKLHTVITIGPDAERWLAPAARERGCNVVSFTSPYQAGDYARSVLQPNAVVLAKGSQNRVFAEEALKSLLAQKKDAARLVRQSPYWLGIKRKQFGKAAGEGR